MRKWRATLPSCATFGAAQARIAELKRLSAGSGIRLFDNDEVVVESVRFLGTMLWADFMLFGEGEKRTAAMQEAQRFMRDFSGIRIGEAAVHPRSFCSKERR